MRLSEKHEIHDDVFAGCLCALGIILAALAPFVSSWIFGRSSPSDEIGGVLLTVALVAILVDRR